MTTNQINLECCRKKLLLCPLYTLLAIIKLTGLQYPSDHFRSYCFIFFIVQKNSSLTLHNITFVQRVYFQLVSLMKQQRVGRKRDRKINTIIFQNTCVRYLANVRRREETKKKGKAKNGGNRVGENLQQTLDNYNFEKGKIRYKNGLSRGSCIFLEERNH